MVPAEWAGHEWETNPVTPLRLMAVHAHPDDEASKGAATTAKYVAEGVEVMVVTCTGGERGDVLNAKVQELVDLHGLSTVRQQEMKAAAEVLSDSTPQRVATPKIQVRRSNPWVRPRCCCCGFRGRGRRCMREPP